MIINNEQRKENNKKKILLTEIRVEFGVQEIKVTAIEFLLDLFWLPIFN
jgi:hypothetical protein